MLGIMAVAVYNAGTASAWGPLKITAMILAAMVAIGTIIMTERAIDRRQLARRAR